MTFSYIQIIKEAWEFTQNNKKLIMVYAFSPALFSTLAGIVTLIYQYFAFLSSPLFENWQNNFTVVFISNVFNILKEHIYLTGPLIVLVIIILIFYFLLPSFCSGAVIQLIARKRNKQEVKIRDGFRYGMLSFLPLFEYSLILRSFSFVSMISWTSFVARNLGWGALYAFLPLAIFFIVVDLIITLLFTYTEFFIVIDDRKVIKSISKSCVLVITHLEKTLFLSLLMLIISIRIIVQVIFVLLIPSVVGIIIYFITSSALPILAIVVGSVIGIFLLYLASYLNGTIYVFASAVWTFTFLELTKNNEVSARKKN